MPQALHHLVYQSTATMPMGEPELQALLTQSRAWNSSHGLTGLLLYSNGDIMQVLEGTAEEVRYIFGRIAQDYRHIHVVKLSDGPIEQRNFSQWSMGFKAVNPDDFMHLTGYLNLNQPKHLTEVQTTPDAALHDVLATFVTNDEIRF